MTAGIFLLLFFTLPVIIAAPISHNNESTGLNDTTSTATRISIVTSVYEDQSFSPSEERTKVNITDVPLHTLPKTATSLSSDKNAKKTVTAVTEHYEPIINTNGITQTIPEIEKVSKDGKDLKTESPLSIQVYKDLTEAQPSNREIVTSGSGTTAIYKIPSNNVKDKFLEQQQDEQEVTLDIVPERISSQSQKKAEPEIQNTSVIPEIHNTSTEVTLQETYTPLVSVSNENMTMDISDDTESSIASPVYETSKVNNANSPKKSTIYINNDSTSEKHSQEAVIRTPRKSKIVRKRIHIPLVCMLARTSDVETISGVHSSSKDRAHKGRESTLDTVSEKSKDSSKSDKSLANSDVLFSDESEPRGSYHKEENRETLNVPEKFDTNEKSILIDEAVDASEVEYGQAAQMATEEEIISGYPDGVRPHTLDKNAESKTIISNDALKRDTIKDKITQVDSKLNIESLVESNVKDNRNIDRDSKTYTSEYLTEETTVTPREMKDMSGFDVSAGIEVLKRKSPQFDTRDIKLHPINPIKKSEKTIIGYRYPINVERLSPTQFSTYSTNPPNDINQTPDKTLQLNESLDMTVADQDSKSDINKKLIQQSTIENINVVTKATEDEENRPKRQYAENNNDKGITENGNSEQEESSHNNSTKEAFLNPEATDSEEYTEDTDSISAEDDDGSSVPEEENKDQLIEVVSEPSVMITETAKVDSKNTNTNEQPNSKHGVLQDTYEEEVAEPVTSIFIDAISQNKATITNFEASTEETTKTNLQENSEYITLPSINDNKNVQTIKPDYVGQDKKDEIRNYETTEHSTEEFLEKSSSVTPNTNEKITTANLHKEYIVDTSVTVQTEDETLETTTTSTSTEVNYDNEKPKLDNSEANGEVVELQGTMDKVPSEPEISGENQDTFDFTKVKDKLIPKEEHETTSEKPRIDLLEKNEELRVNLENTEENIRTNCEKKCEVTHQEIICGTDSEVYNSLCEMQCVNQDLEAGPWENCRGKNILCPLDCLDIYDPVCGEDGQIYRNLCQMRKKNCGKQIETRDFGMCVNRTRELRSCPDKCPEEYRPVCGSNRKLYDNICLLKKENCGKNVRVVRLSRCVQRGRCPSYCLPLPDPVCGSDGRMYLNLCRLRLETCGKQIRRMPKRFCGTI